MTGTGTTRVLVGFADALAAVESAWSLRDSGFQVVAVAKPGTGRALRAVRGVSVLEVAAPERDASACLRDIARVVDEVRPDAVLPLDDQMVWLGERLRATCEVQMLPRGSHDMIALDKRLQLCEAERAGLAVPPTQVVDTYSDWPAGCEFPIVVKPALAVECQEGTLTRQDAAICRDAAQFEQARARLRPPLLIQPLLTGRGEGVFGLATQDGVTAWSGHQRIRMMNPQGSGASACQAWDPSPELRDQVTRFITAIGWRGMFMVELLRDHDGRPWFMELNGRAWGSMAMARRRGFAYPAWTVQGGMRQRLDPPPPTGAPHLECRHLGRELVHLAFVLRGPKPGPDPAWPRRGRTVIDLVTARRGVQLYNVRRGESRVLLHDTLDTLSLQARRLRGRS